MKKESSDNMFEFSDIISHRGIHDNQTIYENTLEAFKKAIDKGYSIEMDIRLTKDNKLVVFHDQNTKRITGIDKIVEKSTYQELNQQNTIHIPLLEEVLDLVDGQVSLLIEIKQPNKVGKLESNLMTLLTNYSGKYAIQSFNPQVLYWFKKNYPHILRGQLSSHLKNKNIPLYQKFILKNMLLNPIIKPHFISYKYNELPINKIKYYQKKNIKVLGWTITNKEDYQKYKDIYNNLICEKFL